MNIIEYAEHFIGKPYIWAGSGAVGFDCSGLVIECLQAFGHLPLGDWSAQGLYDVLRSKHGWMDGRKVNSTQIELAFFQNQTTKKMTHVALMIDNNHFIEAGGGDSKCTSAENSTGMVRIRPISWRKPTHYLFK